MEETSGVKSFTRLAVGATPLGRLSKPLILGPISVGLNTAVDLTIVTFAISLGRFLRTNPRFHRNQRLASGVGMIGLGTFVAFGERK